MFHRGRVVIDLLCEVSMIATVAGLNRTSVLSTGVRIRVGFLTTIVMVDGLTTRPSAARSVRLFGR